MITRERHSASAIDDDDIGNTILPLWQGSTQNLWHPKIPTIVSGFQVDHGNVGVDSECNDNYFDDRKCWQNTSFPTLIRTNKKRAKRTITRVAPIDNNGNEPSKLGNCLIAHVDPNSDTVLLSRGGSNNGTLVISPVTVSQKSEVSADDSKAESYWVFGKEEPILQLNACVFNGVSIYGTRRQTTCNVLRLGRKLGSKLKPLTEFKTVERNYYVDIDLRFDLEEILLSTVLGELTLGNLKTRHTTKLDLDSDGQNWIGCRFGSHPRCIVSASIKDFMLHDIRMSCARKLKLFSVTSPLALPNESICCFLKHPVMDELSFVSTSSSVFLVDERYCKRPVMRWGHLLNSSPTMMHGTWIPSTRELLLSLNSGMELSMIHAHHGNDNAYDIQSAHSTVKINTPCDFAKFSLHRGYYDQQDVSTLPIVGLATIAADQRAQYASILQLTSNGSLFSLPLTLESKLDRQECSGLNHNDDVNRFNVQWNDQFTSKESMEHFAMDSACEGDIRHSEALVAALQVAKEKNPECGLCTNGNVSSNNDGVCDSCGNNISFTNSALNHFRKDKLITDRSLAKEISNFNFSGERNWNSYTDETSRNIRNVWEDEELDLATTCNAEALVEKPNEEHETKLFSRFFSQQELDLTYVTNVSQDDSRVVKTPRLNSNICSPLVRHTPPKKKAVTTLTLDVGF